MDVVERRREHRSAGAGILHPVSFFVRIGNVKVPTEVINYHYRGACLRLDEVARESANLKEGDRLSVDFFLGKNCLKQNIPVRVTWEEVKGNGTFGIEFLSPSASFVRKAERIRTHEHFPPILTSRDPLDPNRLVSSKVRDLSTGGMLLATSLTNRHLFPGMVLKECSLLFPGQDAIKLDVTIENARPGDEHGLFHLGVAVAAESVKFRDAVRSYLSCYSKDVAFADRFLELSEKNLLARRLKEGLTFRIISDARDYEKLLKLRYVSYSSHGKVKASQGPRDMGEGLEREGLLVCGFLGGEMVASMELRFGDGKIPFRIEKILGGSTIPRVDRATSVEVSKLVVHPSAQGSDIVVGMFQRAHAIIVARGGYDCLIMATDALVRMYEKLGFEHLDIRFPHSVNEAQFLNLMLLRKEWYMNGPGKLNPATWNLVYQTTHEYMRSIGLVSDDDESEAKASSEKPQNAEFPTPGPTSARRFSDAKWTAQHMLAPIVLPYLLEADEMIGAGRVDSLLEGVGLSRDYFSNQSNWVSVAFLDEFLDRFSQWGDVADLSWRAGMRSMQRDVLGINFYILRHFLSPQSAFREFERLAQRFNLTRVYRVETCGSRRARVSIGLVNRTLLPKHKESCLNWQASFLASVKTLTGKDGRVRKLSCCYQGSESCTYEITWPACHKPALTLLAAGGGVALAAAGLASLFPTQSVLTASATLAAAGLGVWNAFLQLRLRRVVRDGSEFDKEFERFEQETADRYLEFQAAKKQLDQRYHEAKLLEETARSIQKSNELHGILRVSLDAVCNKFGFVRAFVMLAEGARGSEETKTLRTAAVSGISEGLGEVWGYSIELTAPREGHQLLSTVFYTGNPVIINDVESHLFQLNESSRNLIRKLGARSFIIVPIPSDSGNWGVLIADRKSELSKVDLVLLQRVAQHIGIALDKQARYDEQVRLRLLFQKYVPYQPMTTEETVGLGGQVRDIVCMFLDIRDFTRISNALPTQVTLDLLNRVFTMVEREVTEMEGLIDKFMGDGALVTWGAITGSCPDGNQAVRAAMKILTCLRALNRDLAKEGLPQVNVGMGIHRGPAIVGNVGSENRMEFTSIGPTVNLASRIEGLCKTFNASLLISEAVLVDLVGPLKDMFQTRSEVAVRGMDRPLCIGIYRDSECVEELAGDGDFGRCGEVLAS